MQELPFPNHADCTFRRHRCKSIRHTSLLLSTNTKVLVRGKFPTKNPTLKRGAEGLWCKHLCRNKFRYSSIQEVEPYSIQFEPHIHGELRTLPKNEAVAIQPSFWHRALLCHQEILCIIFKCLVTQNLNVIRCYSNCNSRCRGKIICWANMARHQCHHGFARHTSHCSYFCHMRHAA